MELSAVAYFEQLMNANPETTTINQNALEQVNLGAGSFAIQPRKQVDYYAHLIHDLDLLL